MSDPTDWLLILLCLGFTSAVAVLGLNRAARAAHRRVEDRRAVSEREHQAARLRLEDQGRAARVGPAPVPGSQP